MPARNGGLLMSDDSDGVPDLDLPPAVSGGRSRKVFFKKRKSDHRMGGSSTVAALTSNEWISPHCLLCSLIAALVFGLATLTLYTFAICNELRHFEKSMNDVTALNKARMITLEQEVHRLRVELSLIRDDGGGNTAVTNNATRSTTTTMRALVEEKLIRIAEQVTEIDRQVKQNNKDGRERDDNQSNDVKQLSRRVSMLELCAALHSCETAPPNKEAEDEKSHKQNAGDGQEQPMKEKVMRRGSDQLESDKHQPFVFSRIP